MFPQPPAPGAPGEWAGAGYKRRPAVGSGGCVSGGPLIMTRAHPPGCTWGARLGGHRSVLSFLLSSAADLKLPRGQPIWENKNIDPGEAKEGPGREVLLRALSVSAAGCMGPASSSITPTTPRELRRFPPGFSPAWVLGGETGIGGSGEQVFLSLNGGRGGRCMCQEPART